MVDRKKKLALMGDLKVLIAVLDEAEKRAAFREVDLEALRSRVNSIRNSKRVHGMTSEELVVIVSVLETIPEYAHLLEDYKKALSDRLHKEEMADQIRLLVKKAGSYAKAQAFILKKRNAAPDRTTIMRAVQGVGTDYQLSCLLGDLKGIKSE